MYTVIYRTGGPDRYGWCRTLAFGTYAEMQIKAAEVERMGYKTLIHNAKLLQAIGLPETWE